MASSSRENTDHLVQRLTDHAPEYDFFQVARLLQCHFKNSPRIGNSWLRREDAFRFAQHISLCFAPTAIRKFHQPDGNKPPKLEVSFFGLLGPNGPMPLQITEYVLDRKRDFGDETLAQFLDIFHHRLLGFFFRAWADNRKTVDLDRPDGQKFNYLLGSLLGLGMDSLMNRDAVPDEAKLYFSERLSAKNRNAEGLEAILSEYFGISANIITFMGRWVDLPLDSSCRLGESPKSCGLGTTAVVGSRIWDCQHNFRIRFGPMELSDYERMLPGGQSFERVKTWVLNYVGQQFHWDVQLVLKAGEVPDSCLGISGRLGWTSWLKTEGPLQYDHEDTIIMGSH